MLSKGSIFISYRRSDSMDVSGRIYDRLEAKFGEGHIFRDVYSIPYGVDFRKYLDEAVGKCQVLLAIVGPTWLNTKDEHGNRRLDNPNDFVRIEIESALKREGILVIPVLVGNARMPTDAELPPGLKDLAYRNAAQVRSDPDFHRDMSQLIDEIETFSGRLKPENTRVRVALKSSISMLRYIGKFFETPKPEIETPKSEISAKPQPSAPTLKFEIVSVNAQGAIKDRRQGQAEYRTEDLGNGISLDLVMIPGGRFLMGSPNDEEGRSDDESPQHQVNVRSFLMGKYSVTQAQWKAVAALPKIERDLESDPSRFKGNNRPVETVSWHDAIEFCKRLSKKTGRDYRLPSEAEWEYACRAGTNTPFYFGETITTDLANYRGTDWEYEGKTYPGFYGQGSRGIYREETTEVGIFPPNAFGLYDMHGNVWEWCFDHWHDSYEGAPIDGSAWIAGGDDKYHPLRGSAWYYSPSLCRSALRVKLGVSVRDILVSFRVVCASAWTLP